MKQYTKEVVEINGEFLERLKYENIIRKLPKGAKVYMESLKKMYNMYLRRKGNPSKYDMKIDVFCKTLLACKVLDPDEEDDLFDYMTNGKDA